MEVLEKPCGVSRDPSESQSMAPGGSAGGRGSVAKVQLGSAAAPRLPCADAVAAAAAAAAVPAFAATVSAAADPAASGSLHCSGGAGSKTRQLRGSRNGRRTTELRHRGAGGTRSGRGQRGNPGEPGPERGAAGGRGGEVCSLRSWGFSSPAHLSPPASPSGVGAPAGSPGDEPGLEVAGECGPGTWAGVASGERVGYFRGGALSCPARVPLGPLQPRELTGHSLPAGILGQNCIPRGCRGHWQDGEPCLTCYTSTKGKRRRIREGCGHRLGPA